MTQRSSPPSFSSSLFVHHDHSPILSLHHRFFLEVFSKKQGKRKEKREEKDLEEEEKERQSARKEEDSNE